jgi:enoyl-CoA hydratase/carnithine racemase
MIVTFQHGDIRELRLNRPPVNALTPELISALQGAINSATQEGARALVLSGSPGIFSAGLDIPALLKLDPTSMQALWRDFYRLLGIMAKSPIPIAAALTGHAPAGGTVISLFCDWRVAAEGDGKLGLSEVLVGLPLPPVIYGALQRLVGIREAQRLALFGLLINPAQALTLGLVDELVPLDHVVPRAIAWCEQLLKLPTVAMQTTRKLARADLARLFEAGIDAEIEMVAASWWHEQTQRALRVVADRLTKKK